MTVFPKLILSLLLAASPAAAAPPSTALVLDTSGSMEGEKARAMKEGTKLAIALLDGVVYIIPFNNLAQVQAFHLTSPEQRKKAMAYVDQLPIGGGTKYPEALKEVNRLPKGTVTVFLTDGENNGAGGDAAVFALVKHCPGPIHTIAVSAPANAHPLLLEMAARSGGMTIRIEQADDLTTKFIEIARGLADYRAYEPSRNVLQFAGVQPGEWIGVGMGRQVEVEANPALSDPLYRHEARLPGRTIHLVRFAVRQASNLLLRGGRPESPDARLARVLRKGLPVARHTRSTVDGKVPAGGHVDLATVFLDPKTGQRVSATPEQGLGVQHVLRDPATGRELGKTEAVAEGDTYKARVPVPPSPGPLVVESETAVIVNGAPFTEKQSTIILSVETLYQGLSLPSDSPIRDMGRFVTGTGLVELGAFVLGALDRDAVEYVVDVEALSSSTTAIPTQAAPGRITLRAGQPESFQASATIGDVPPGVYTGRAIVHSPQVKGRWTLPFRITVLAALTAAPVEFGTLRPGHAGRASLRIRNDAATAMPARLTAQPFQAKGGSIELTVPEHVKLEPKGETGVEIKIRVNELVQSRGPLETVLVLKRGDWEMTIPVKVRIDTTGPERLLVAPEKIEASGKPGEVVKFLLIVTPGAGAELPDQLQVRAGAFQTRTGEPAEVLVETQMKVKHLRDNTGLTVSGHLLLPRLAGTYAGSIRIESDRNAGRMIPITIHVK